jgi:hypothetical protein
MLYHTGLADVNQYGWPFSHKELKRAVLSMADRGNVEYVEEELSSGQTARSAVTVSHPDAR